MFTYAYNCVNSEDIDELNFIIENEETITLEEFKNKVNIESFNEIVEALGYSDNFPIEGDYYVSYHTSKTPNGENVIYIEHSCIEYIFKCN